jgi:tetratricopeptide (TPR) repeat protein
MPQIGIYVGWYEFNVTGAFSRPTMEFMPGAFAYHLHSFSAQTIRDPNARWVGPLLARGATCTLGTTEEPYLEGTPDMAAFLGRFLFGGYSFGEAAYSSMKFLSWQTTVVGDPLYRPFTRRSQDVHEELLRTKSKFLEWSFLRVVNINLATDLPVEKAIDYLMELPDTKTSAVLSEKLGDLCKSKGKFIDAMEPYERALKLKPTPQQRLRIALAVTPVEVNFGHGREAYEILKGVLKDYPDYPDRLTLLQRILPLADQFGKAGEAAEYDKELKALAPKGS